MAFQWKPIKNLFNCQSVTFNTFTGTQRRANHDHFPKDCQHSPFGSNAVTNSHHCLLHLQSTGLNMLTISALLSSPYYICPAPQRAQLVQGKATEVVFSAGRCAFQTGQRGRASRQTGEQPRGPTEHTGEACSSEKQTQSVITQHRAAGVSLRT